MINNHTILKYVMDNFRLTHDIDGKNISIQYGDNTDGAIKVETCNQQFFREKTAESSFPDHIIDSFEGKEIPFLFSNEKKESAISKSDDGKIILHYDIISGIFYFLSGWQEVVCQKKDHYGRFPYSESIQKKLGIIETPVVNYYFDLLAQAIEKAYAIKVRRKLENHPMLTFLSHDIDQCRTGWKEAGFNTFKKMRFWATAKIAFNRIFGKDVWFNFNDILKFNESHNIHAAFFFLTRKGLNTKHNIMNADYDIRQQKFEEIFRSIEKSQCEVGLQGSLDTGIVQEEMQKDVETMPYKISGNRCHFLLYQIEKLGSIMDAAGITYDNTAGFAEHVGFRNSTAFPFYLFDYENKKTASCIELPLVIMDRTLSQKQYMGVAQNEAEKVTATIIKEVAKFNGVLSILWHNHHFSPYKFKGWKGVLEGITKHVNQHNTEFLSGAEIIDLLKKNG